MLTAEQIDQGDPFLSDIAVKQLLSLIRSLPRYRQFRDQFPNLETKLNSLKVGTITASDEVLARISNAALAQIESIGPGQTILDGKVKWSKRAKREEFIEDVLNALYESESGADFELFTLPTAALVYDL
jgi:hypothetical protein